tara:strand:- start:1227 stop:1436 length:210 start_codon:yes stop_codon:yes gene_type:complete
MPEKDFFYTTTVDLSIAGMYNNRGCRECYGKGYFVSHIPAVGDSFDKNIESQETYTYCKCVVKNMKLYG